MPSLFSSLGDLDFFRGALPEAVLWGRIALGVGLAGLLVSSLLVLSHFRDRFSLTRGSGSPAEYRPPRWGPLDRALGRFFRDPLHFAPLSPDAASEYVGSRLDAEHDVTHSILRYFAYAPLLLGLMGTTFALRTLLVLSGDTLQEIQPQLSGVFAGTLAGIGGSLVAAVGGLVLDRVALTSANRAQDFIHQFIIPTLPERRIAIRIEDAVLTAISERAQAVVETFRAAIQPVASELESVAGRCAKAAEAATDAFSEASRALREAGDLEVASRHFKTSAHMIDSSAELLSDATKQTAEVVLRAGEVRGSLKSLTERIQVASDALGSSSERVGGQLDAQLSAIKGQVADLNACANRLTAATEVLADELIRRSKDDSAQIETTTALIDSTNRQVAELRDVVVASGHVIREELRPYIDSSAARATGTIQELVDRHFTAVHDKLGEFKPAVQASGPVAGPEPAVGEAVGEIRKVAEDTKALLGEVRRLQSHQDRQPKGGFRWPWR